MRVKVGGKAHSKGWSIMVEIKKEILAWWLRHVILATQRLRWEDHKFKVSLGNFAKPCPKTLKDRVGL